MVEKLLASAATDPIVAVTRGYTRALGLLSPYLQKKFLAKIVDKLAENCKIKSKDSDDADTRKYAVKSIENLVRSIGIQDESITQEIWDKIFDLCLLTMKDYSVDKRGDIGSIVREASMFTMANLLNIFYEGRDERTAPLEVSGELMYKIICVLLQQIVEKIDRVRLVAGSLLQDIFDNLNSKLPDFPQKQRL